MTTTMTMTMTTSNDVPLTIASRAIDALLTSAEQHHARAQQLSDSPVYSDDHKRELLHREREAFLERHRTACHAATGALDAAEKSAAQHLARPGDEALETRKARAATRVSRILDAGCPAIDAAQVFADQGDIDALRALRDDLPSWTVATLGDTGVEARSYIEANLLALDRLMAPLLTGDDAAAVRTRLRVDAERTRLRAATEHALNPTPGSRLRLHYSSNPV